MRIVKQLPKHDNGAQKFKLKLTDMFTLADQKGWIELMDFIYSELPFLSKASRPTNIEIQNSKIGKLGYASWKHFIKEEYDWTPSKWKEWQKAYKRVQDFSYLRELKVSRHQINEAYKQSKGDFPPDKVSWNLYVQSKKDTQTHGYQSNPTDIVLGMVLEQLEDVIKDRNLQKSITDRKDRKISFLIKQLNKQKLEIEQCDQAIEEGVRNQKIIFFLSLFVVLLLVVSHFLN